jgi:hypothetical protein
MQEMIYKQKLKKKKTNQLKRQRWKRIKEVYLMHVASFVCGSGSG